MQASRKVCSALSSMFLPLFLSYFSCIDIAKTGVLVMDMQLALNPWRH